MSSAETAIMESAEPQSVPESTGSTRELLSGYEGYAYVDGRNALRTFDISYLTKSKTRFEEILMELPRKRTLGWKAEEAVDDAAPRHDSAQDSTVMSRTSGSGSQARRNARKRMSRRGRMNLKDNEVAEAELLALTQSFENIKVFKTDSRLGRFDNSLTFAPPDPVVLNFLTTDEGHVPDFDPLNHCFMQSCGDVQMAHLKMYDRVPKTGPDFSSLSDPQAGLVALNNAVDWVRDKLALDQKLPRLKELSLQAVRVNPKKSAGAYYRLLGYKSRGGCLSKAMVDAEEAIVTLLEGDMVAQRPTRIGGRGKPVKMGKEEAIAKGVKKGRAIHMTDTRDHLLLGLTEQVLNDAWKPDRYPISVGRGWMHGDASAFVKKFEWGNRFYCFDAEKFDSSLDPWLLHVAFQIMREQFQDGLESEYDAYWHFAEESLSHSFVYRDDGIIFEKDVGTSSGHNHNSLAQSICTLIMCAFHVFYVNRHLTKETIIRNFDAEGLGDDNFLAETDILKEETVEDRALRNYDVFGVNWGGEKSYMTDTLCEASVSDERWDETLMYNTAQYLGKYFRTYYVKANDSQVARIAIPHRPWVETVVRLLYPEGFKLRSGQDDVDDVHGDGRAERIAGHMIDGFGNPNARVWLQDLLRFAMHTANTPRPGFSQRLLHRWERLRVEIDSYDINFEDFEFSSWLTLVAAQRGVPVPVELIDVPVAARDDL